MQNKKILFAGMGAANVFAALYLIDKGFDAKNITMIDSGRDPMTRTSLLHGWLGAGAFSDSKWVFSLHEDQLSQHITIDEKREYHIFIQKLIRKYFNVEDHMLSNPVSEDKVSEYIPVGCGIELKQSVCVHLGTSNGVLMGKAMYKHMIDSGIELLFGHNIINIDLERMVVECRTKRGHVHVLYDYLQVGIGKTGVNFMDKFISDNDIKVDYGYGNVGGRMEMNMNDKLTSFSNEVQYDFKMTRDYGNGMSARNFCVCHNSAYVVEEGIDATITYNGHAFGKFHERQNNMTNFGVMVRIKGINALEFQRSILSKHGKGGCAIRGKNWSGISTINKVAKEITWEEYRVLYSDIKLGAELTDVVKDFVEFNDNMFGLNGDYSLYIPEIKMAAGVIKTNKLFNLEDGRYPEVSFVGDGTSGSIGLTPSAITGFRGVERLLR